MPVAIAHLEARPGADDTVARILTDLVARTALEPGALTYVVHRDPARPTRFIVYERYVDADALAAHMRAPWLRAALGVLGDALETAPAIEMLDDVLAFQRASSEVAR